MIFYLNIFSTDFNKFIFFNSNSYFENYLFFSSFSIKLIHYLLAKTEEFFYTIVQVYSILGNAP